MTSKKTSSTTSATPATLSSAPESVSNTVVSVKKVKSQKPKETKVETSSSSTPVEASSSVSTKSKAKSAKPSKSESVTASLSVEESTTAPASTLSSSVAPLETANADQHTDFLAKLQQLSVIISSLKTEYRGLEKKWSRELKASQKLSSKRKRKAGNRAPAGFVKPTKISDELASFLGKEKGAEMARTEVTREINTYIRANKLQDKENGRNINPDSKLAVLLKLQKDDELTYFNLQKYMSHHFAKAVKPAESVSVV